MIDQVYTSGGLDVKVMYDIKEDLYYLDVGGSVSEDYTKEELLDIVTKIKLLLES